jgi:hypothetical protein
MVRWLLLLLFLFTVVVCMAPEQPTVTETWITNADGQVASVSGRAEQPIWKKVNPVWWVLNDDEPDPPDWQLPNKPYLVRQLSWFVRNPFQNFGNYVVGVHDRNYTVIGMAPVYATSWSDVGPHKQGWKTSTIHLGALRLPFVSYENDQILWYAGWQWSGFFGFKFIVKNSTVQFW